MLRFRRPRHPPRDPQRDPCPCSSRVLSVPSFLDATEEDTTLHLTPKPRGPVDGPFSPRRCQLEPLLLDHLEPLLGFVITGNRVVYGLETVGWKIRDGGGEGRDG